MEWQYVQNMTGQQEEKEDDMSVQESYTAKILRITEESKQNKSAYRPLTHVCPGSVMVERLLSDAKHIMTDGSLYSRDVVADTEKNKDLWNSETIDNIINNEEEDAPAPVIGDKRQHADDDDEDDDSDIDDR